MNTTTRSSVLMLLYYAIIGISGVLFIIVPPTSVSALYIHYDMDLIELFGIFYAVGGLTGFFAVAGRKIFKLAIAPTWYFEIAGLSLLLSASVFYTFSLTTRGIQTEDLNTFALGLLIAGMNMGVIARIYETYLLTKLYKNLKEREE